MGAAARAPRSTGRSDERRARTLRRDAAARDRVHDRPAARIRSRLLVGPMTTDARLRESALRIAKIRRDAAALNRKIALELAMRRAAR